MSLKQLQLTEIQYAKDLGDGLEFVETPPRKVIPTFVPHSNFKAVDVSGLSKDEQQEMLSLLEEYNAYYTQQAQAIFNFEDWVEHTKGKKVSAKWRTFKLENTKVLD